MKNENFMNALEQLLNLMEKDQTIYLNENCTNNFRETFTEIDKTADDIIQRNYNQEETIELLFDVIFRKEFFLVSEHHELMRQCFIQRNKPLRSITSDKKLQN
jgi:hypothetical protein